MMKTWVSKAINEDFLCGARMKNHEDDDRNGVAAVLS